MPSLTRLRRIAICIDQKEHRRWRPSGRYCARTAPASAEPAGRSIEQFMTIGAHVVFSNSAHKSRGPSIAQAIAVQFVAAAALPAALPAAPASSRARFEVINGARNSHAPARILALWRSSYRDEPLLPSIEL